MDNKKALEILQEADTPPSASKRLMALTIAMHIYLEKRFKETGTDLQQMLVEVNNTCDWYREIVDAAWETNEFYQAISKEELTSLWERQVEYLAPYIFGAATTLKTYGRMLGIPNNILEHQFAKENQKLFMRPISIDLSFIPVPPQLELQLMAEIYQLAERMAA